MLSSNLKKEALSIHKRALEKYEATFEEFSKEAETLYNERKNAIVLIIRIENFINTIANTPKEIETVLHKISVETDKFIDTETYAKEAYESNLKSGVGIAAGLGAGATFASLSPTAAMWVATTYGVASTGTAISTLSGAAATNAALAWLGGGALATGGAGMSGGTALLALAGPVGWGIAGLSSATTVTLTGFKNSKIAKQAMEEAENITIAGAKLKESTAEICHYLKETKLLISLLSNKLQSLHALKHKQYQEIPETERLELGALVNNAQTMSELLNKNIK